MSNVSEWNVSASSNTSSPPNGAPEGMAPSAVNDTMREMMAANARWYFDSNGSLVSTGSSNAYVLTTNSSHAALSDLSILAFRANHTNTGASTLNVDSLGAKQIRFKGAAIPSGAILQNTIVAVVYNSNADAFDIMSVATIPDAALTSNVPLKDAANTFTSKQTISIDSSELADLHTTHADGGFLRFRRDSSSYGFIGNSDAVNSGTTDNFELYTGNTLVLTGVVGITLNGVNVTDFARLSQSNTFTGATQVISTTGGDPYLGVTDATVSVRVGVNSTDDVAYIGALSDHGLAIVTGEGTTALAIDKDGNFDFKGGAVTTSKASASEVGTLGVPRDSQTADFTVAAAMSGRMQVCTSAADDVTVQASGAPAEGQIVGIENNTGGPIDIIQGSGMTLTLAGTGLTGNRTLADSGIAAIVFGSSGTAKIMGAGLG